MVNTVFADIVSNILFKHSFLTTGHDTALAALLAGARIVDKKDLALKPFQLAVVGSMIEEIGVIRLTGTPLSLACSWIAASSSVR